MYRKFAVACGAVFILAGCTSTAGLRSPDDYPRLTVDPNDSELMVFVRPNVNFGKYGKVHVAPVLVQSLENQSIKDVDDADTRALAQYTEKKLKEALSKTATLVDKPEDGALTVRYRIIDVSPTNPAQIAMMLPPLSLVNMLSPKGVFHGTITLSGQIYEGLDVQPSVAFIGVRSRPGIDATASFGKWTVAEKVIDKSAEKLATGLARERKAFSAEAK